MEGLSIHIEIRAYPLSNHIINGLFCSGEDTFAEWLIGVEPVSLLGDFSVTGETLERTQVSEAAHRTPPGGTEINHLVKRSKRYASEELEYLF